MCVVLFGNSWETMFIITLLINETHVRTLWEKIESLDVSKSGDNKLYLLNFLMTLRYMESSSISYHLTEFQGP